MNIYDALTDGAVLRFDNRELSMDDFRVFQVWEKGDYGVNVSLYHGSDEDEAVTSLIDGTQQ